MEENKIIDQAQATENNVSKEELVEQLKKKAEEVKRKNKESQEAMSQGKGRLALETPILAGDENINELVYDFTELNGIEYTDAMDADMNAQQIYRITYRQALNLFATAAAKETDGVDKKISSKELVSQML